MTREEYLAQTPVKDPNQARSYLRKLKALTAIIGILAGVAVILYSIAPDESVFLWALIPAIILALYGEVYTEKLIKTLGLQRLSTFEYATESSYSLYGWRRYQQLINCLEIIIGIKEPSGAAMSAIKTNSQPPKEVFFLSKLPRSIQYGIFIIVILLIFYVVYLGMK